MKLLCAGPLGLAGHRVLATMWFAAGSAIDDARREAMLEVARTLPGEHGATAREAQLLVLRLLAPRVEPAMQLLTEVRAAWRHIAWGLSANPPRAWRT